MSGMTMKQYHRARFLRLAEQYRTVDPFADTAAFIALSVAVHAASGAKGVPKSWRKYARRPDIDGKRYARTEE